MLPEKMAFWNSLVPSLTKPEPTMVPETTTPMTPATVAPTGQKEASTDKGTVGPQFNEVPMYWANWIVISKTLSYRICRTTTKVFVISGYS